MKKRITLLAALTALFWCAASAAQTVQPPDEVFLYRASAEQGRVVLDWEVVPGHYLYRDRFAFSTDTPGIELGEARFPDGEMHEDEFFGRQEIYRGDFRIAIPYSGSAPELDLAIELQGCADIGLCYPPLEWPATVQLAAAEAPPASVADGGSRFSLRSLLGRGSRQTPQFLPPDEAFRHEVEFTGPNELTVRWTVTDGYYLYRDKLDVSVSDGPLQLGSPQIPAGTMQEDEFFGETYAFFEDFQFTVPFSRESAARSPVTLTLAFQGCAEAGLCYPPLEREVTLTLAAADSGALIGATAGTDGGPAAPRVSEQDRLAALITDSALPLVMVTFFGLGLLLAFTPCVLPLVPIISGIIAGHGQQVTTGKATLLSAAFVLGMAVTYTAAGAVAALAGAQVQAFFQHPWIITAFAGVFVLLALAMFGFYNLQIPHAMQTRLAHASNRLPGGTYTGTTVMGALSALIVTACVAPPLVAALAVIGQSGDVARGSASLFAMSLGMGAPLLLVGASAGRLLPRAGPWMYAVKNAFGLMLLAVAVWMLERVVPGPAALALWAGLAFVIAVFLGALEPLTPGAPAGRRLAKGGGVMAGVYGVILLLGAASGGHDPLKPLGAFSVTADGGAATAGLDFRRISTVAGLERELARASDAGRPVMLDFTADWCVSCKEMERYTFTDPAVQAALSETILLQVDVTANNADDQALLRRFGIFGPPTIAFFDRQGEELAGFRLVGFVAATPFARHVDEALAASGTRSALALTDD